VSWMPLTEELPAFDAAAPDAGNEPTLPLLIPSVGPEEDTAILADGRSDLEPGHRTTVVDVDPVSPTPPPPTHASAVRPMGLAEESLPNPRVTTVVRPAEPIGPSSVSRAHSDLTIMGRAISFFRSAPKPAPDSRGEGPSPLLFRIVLSYASLV